MPEPVNIAMVSNTGVESGEIPTTGVQPNVVVTSVTPLVAIVVRAAHFFLKTTLGMVTVGAFSASGAQLLGAHDALSLFVGAAWWATVPTALGVGWDLVTILARLEQKYPLATGNV